MKKILQLILALGMVTMVGCKDDEPEADPLLGLWELDDATLEYPSEFSLYGFTKQNDAFGETAYTIEFLDDFTYERELSDLPLSSGTTDFSDEGEWEKDGEFLDLDTDDTEIGGLGYSFEITELDDGNLVLEYESSGDFFPNAKIQEWFEDGTLDSEGFFTVTQDQFDSLVTNFISRGVTGTYILEFDRQ